MSRVEKRQPPIEMAAECTFSFGLNGTRLLYYVNHAFAIWHSRLCGAESFLKWLSLLNKFIPILHRSETLNKFDLIVDIHNCPAQSGINNAWLSSFCHLLGSWGCWEGISIQTRTVKSARVRYVIMMKDSISSNTIVKFMEFGRTTNEGSIKYAIKETSASTFG